MPVRGVVHAHKVFPAYAGMSPMSFLLNDEALRFPRLRGDEPHPTALGVLTLMFSPPTRG